MPHKLSWITPASSSLSRLKCGIEPLELDPSIVGGETPIDRASTLVALTNPGRHLPFDGLPIAKAPLQTLALEDAQFNLCHVQPTPVLGRVVDLQFVCEALGLGGCKRLEK